MKSVCSVCSVDIEDKKSQVWRTKSKVLYQGYVLVKERLNK